MDWFTHIFAAVAIGMALRKRRTTALAMAFGAMAPDLDALLTPVTILAPQLWFLDHRTFSHSLLLGLPWALLVTWLVQRPAVLGAWRRVFKVDIALSLDRNALAPMYVGVVLHIAMDALTVQGPALLAPVSAQRVQLNWFYFVDLPPLALSSVLAVLTLAGRGTPRQKTAILAVLLAAVLATGAWRGVAANAVRAESPADVTIPTWNPQDWWTWRTLGNGTVEVSLVAAGRASPLFRASFELISIRGAGVPPWNIQRPREIAEATLDYRAFAMNAYLVALDATEGPSGAWRLAYFDPVRRAQAMYSGSENVFSPQDLVVVVGPDGSVATRWP